MYSTTNYTNYTNCICGETFGSTEVAITAVTCFVVTLILSCPLGMLIGACLHQKKCCKEYPKQSSPESNEKARADTIQQQLKHRASKNLKPALSETFAETAQMQNLIQIEKNLSHGGQLTRTHSRKSLPPTPTKRTEPVQRSNSVSYDVVDLAKVKGNVSGMTEVELKANESYGHTDKRSSTAKSNMTACPLYSTPESKSQQDLLTRQYSNIKLKPKAKRMSEHPAIDHDKVLLESNQSYGQLTASMGQLGAQEPLHEYDYVDTQKL